MRLAGRLAGNDRLAAAESMEVIWSDPESRTESQHVDAILKQKDLGVPEEILWEKLGYSPQEIARIKAIKAEEDLFAPVPPDLTEPPSHRPVPSRQAVLAERYRDALIDVRRRVSTRVDRTWRDLGSWDEADVARFQSRVLPVVQAGQRRTVALTDAYLARATRTRPVGLVADDLIGAAVRNGTDPADVYRRPFVQLWSALSNGAQFMDAMNAAGVRAAQSASTDVSLTMRASAGAFDAQAADEARIVGWERVLDPDACAYCATASTQRYRSANLDPIHANCVVGSTVVESSSARNATRRRYCGEMIVIRTALGYGSPSPRITRY